jgi:hypothetical protein
MADLPKELLDRGHPDVKREYHFINIYGKKDSVELGFGDSLSFITCPLDGAHIVHYAGDPHTVDICPACNEAFEGNDEAVVRYVDKYYKVQLKERINGIKTKLNQLEHILFLLENPSNPIKEANKNNEAYNESYNEANLSENK